MGDGPIVQEGELRIEVREYDTEASRRFRARVMGAAVWGVGDDLQSAISGAASAASEEEIENELGRLWDADGGGEG